MKILAFLFAGYFLIGGMIPYSDYSQLLKLGNLKGHYQIHLNETAESNENLDFIKFLFSHLFFVHTHDHDEEDHHDLTFHSFSNQQSTWINSMSGRFIVFQTENMRVKMEVFAIDPLSSGYRVTIFQPPIT